MIRIHGFQINPGCAILWMGIKCARGYATRLATTRRMQSVSPVFEFPGPGSQNGYIDNRMFIMTLSTPEFTGPENA